MTTDEHAGDEPDRPDAFVKTLRFQMKLTQRDLAEKLGVHPRSVSNWETGTVTPTPAKLEQLQHLADVWRQSGQYWAPDGKVTHTNYYVMTFAQEPDTALSVLRSIKRRLDALTKDVENLIAQFERATATPIDIPKESTE